jgi:hypothetical protein
MARATRHARSPPRRRIALALAAALVHGAAGGAPAAAAKAPSLLQVHLGAGAAGDASRHTVPCTWTVRAPRQRPVCLPAAQRGLPALTLFPTLPRFSVCVVTTGSRQQTQLGPAAADDARQRVRVQRRHGVRACGGASARRGASHAARAHANNRRHKSQRRYCPTSCALCVARATQTDSEHDSVHAALRAAEEAADAAEAAKKGGKSGRLLDQGGSGSSGGGGGGDALRTASVAADDGRGAKSGTHSDNNPDGAARTHTRTHGAASGAHPHENPLRSRLTFASHAALSCPPALLRVRLLGERVHQRGAQAARVRRQAGRARIPGTRRASVRRVLSFPL